MCVTYHLTIRGGPVDKNPEYNYFSFEFTVEMRTGCKEIFLLPSAFLLGCNTNVNSCTALS